MRDAFVVPPLFALAGVLALATPSAAQRPSATSSNVYEAASGRYLDGLAAQCPTKHLDWIAPGETPDHNDEFEATLDPAARARLDPTSNALPGGGLAHCPGVGASCGNAVRLATYDRLGLLPRFVTFMCALPEACTEQSTCSSTESNTP